MTEIHTGLRAAIRQHLLTLQRCTTGPLTNVSVSGSTYTRGSGSFVTDGFVVGDEITASGFASATNNGTGIITALSATQMTVDRTLASAGAGASVTLAVNLPAARHWEGEVFTPTPGRPFAAETMLVPYSIPRSVGPNGVVEHRVVLALAFVFPTGKGTNPVEKMAAAALNHFQRGTILSYGTHRGRVSQVERLTLIQEPDWLRCPVNVTIMAYTVG